jgi:hypothetical protein
VYFLWKKEKKRNDYRQQTAYYPLSYVIPVGREHDEASKDRMERQVWPPDSVACITQRAQMSLTQ